MTMRHSNTHNLVGSMSATRKIMIIFAGYMIQTMKRYISAILSAMLMLASCSDELSQTPAVSFVTSGPVSVEFENAKFSIVSRNYTSKDACIIPVIFSGTAEKGVDYTVSSEAFVLGGDAPVDSIVVTALVLGSDKTVSMSLDIPDGIEAGAHRTAGFTLQDKFGYMTFGSSHSLLADTLTFTLGVLDRNGKAQAVGKDADITVSVNTEKSTAVEGTHFEFADSAHVTIKAGSAAGKLRLATIGEPVEGQDIIVLDISYDKGLYGEGLIQQSTIAVLGGRFASLEGKWKIDTLITDSVYMKNIWGESCTLLEELPKFKASDAVTFSMETCTFTPSFSSGFRNYFTGASHLWKDASYTLDKGEGEYTDLQLFMFDNTNRWFSAEEQSEDKNSLVGIRMIQDEETSEDLLDLYILDHNSKAFMPELEYGEEKPAAASRGKYLNAVFRKN